MALKAGASGLSAGSSRLIGGPGDTLRGRSRSHSQATVECLCFAGSAVRATVWLMSCSGADQRLVQNWHGQGESDCLIKTKHCDGQRLMLTQCDFCPVL